MNPAETPFYLTPVECPVCKTVNEYETIKMGAYAEDGRDTDFCPTGLRWRNERYQQINPLLYFMAACSSCFYTREFNRKFREWKSDNTFRLYRQATVRQRHLSLLAAGDGPLRRLGSAIWPTSFPLPTAINKLLLGVLDEETLDQPSHFDLGRWYLRIGWLFREAGDSGLVLPSGHTSARQQLTAALSELGGDAARLRSHVADVGRLVEQKPESAALSPDDNEGPSRFRQAIEGLADRISGFSAELDALTRSLAADPGPMVGGEDSAGGEAYGDYASYGAFLASLQADWPGIPINEVEALRFSLQHYRQAYEEGRGIDPGNAQIQVAYMIGELARRVGDSDQAQQYLNLAMRLGREWIHKMGVDKTKTALARHIVDLAAEQMHRLRDATAAATGR